MTLEEYRQLVQDFIDTGADSDAARWTLLNGKMIHISETMDKYPVYWNADELYIFFTEDLLLSTSTATNYLTMLTSFYDYAISRGLITINPCHSQRLTARNIIDNAKNRKPYYTDKEINEILNSIKLNQEVNTAILLSYYEGVASRSRGLADLKLGDFHPEKREIRIKMGMKKISKKLSDAYRGLKGVEYIIGDKPLKGRLTTRKTAVYRINPDDLFPTTCKNPILFLNNRLDNIGLMSGYDLYCADLYYSGFLNFVAADIGKDKCVDLVLNDGNSGYKTLCEYADKWLFPTFPFKIRGMLKGTAIAMSEY